MRKIVTIFLILLNITILWPISVQAGFGVSPPWIIENHLLPGSHCEKKIYVEQDDPSNLTYCHVIVDESEIKDWITIDPGFDFPFIDSQFPLGVIIDVPENASLGDYNGTMVIEKIVYNQEGQVVIVLGVQVTISLTVIDYNYTYYEVDVAATPDIHIGESMNVYLTIDNQGNTYACPPYVIVDIYDISNSYLLETHNLTNWTAVPPFTRTAITKQCQCNQTCGEYWNHISIPDKPTWLVFMRIVQFPVLSNPIPQNGSTMVPPLNTVLSWSCAGLWLTYDVYIGTVNPPPQIISNQSENSFVPILNDSTTYYWKIVAWDYLRGNCIGPLWSFTTAPPNEPPYPPSDPYPPNNATDIPLTANLSWNGSDPNEWDTVAYDVYFGTSSNPPLRVNNQSGTTYNLETLSYLTTYHWKIVAWDNHGASTAGALWNFTTKASSPPVYGTPSPHNGSTGNPLQFTWSIPISDPEGDLFSWTIHCSNGQTKSETNQTNGTKSLALSGLAYSTTYKVWVNATDPTGSGLYTRRWYTFTTKANLPPVFGTPTPANSSTSNSLSLTWSIPINDSEGNTVSWTIQCNNGQTNSGSGATNGTKILSFTGLAYSTTYKVWVNATDPGGSGLYTRKWYIFTTKENHAPNPPTITGPTQGKTKVQTTYNFTTTDPDNDHVYYFIDWGDNTNTSWIGDYASGELVTKSHTWTEQGTYTIKAKAKDTSGAESDWGTLQVTMPLSYEPPHFRFFAWLLERFPHAFPILRHLLGY
jgi:hypothetical protein